MDTRIKILLSCLLVAVLAIVIVRDEINRRHVSVKGIATNTPSSSTNKSKKTSNTSSQSAEVSYTQEFLPTPTSAPEVQNSAENNTPGSSSDSNDQNSQDDSTQNNTSQDEQPEISITPIPEELSITPTPTGTRSSDIVILGNGANCTNEINNPCIVSSPTPAPVGASSENSATVSTASPTPTLPNTGGNTTIFTGNAPTE